MLLRNIGWFSMHYMAFVYISLRNVGWLSADYVALCLVRFNSSNMYFLYKTSLRNEQCYLRFTEKLKKQIQHDKISTVLKPGGGGEGTLANGRFFNLIIFQANKITKIIDTQ
jgi:hypothetical protein